MASIKKRIQYLETVQKEIAQVQIKQKRAKKEALVLLGNYLNLLQQIERQYQAENYIGLIDAAYEQLDVYLDKYLDLLIPKNAARFNRADPKIILHMGDRAGLRRYPLTEIYLIAIQEEDIRANPPIWTSLAHELGHFVYWNSEFDVSSTSKTAEQYNTLFLDEIWESLGVDSADIKLPSSDDENISPGSPAQVVAESMGAWSEEIFADTLGVYLAGKEFFTESKNLYLKGVGSETGGRFLQDGDHPFPFLRPYIAAKALENKTGTPNNLWRSFKDEIRKNYQEKFLGDLEGLPDGTVTDDDIVLPVEVDGTTKFEIDLDSFKSAIMTTIGILAAKIRSSKPAGRARNIFELIEEFGGPGGQGLLGKTKEGLAYWIKKFLKNIKRKKYNN
jgi:hypothetical protein